MRRVLYRFYWWIEQWFVPGLCSSQYHYYKTIKSLLRDQCRWLDVGCGHQIFADWMLNEEREVAARAGTLVGIDLDAASLSTHKTIRNKVLASLERLPFPSHHFDAVTANMTVEHIEDPSTVLREIHRVLRPGGLFIFHTPNLQNFMIRIASHTALRLKKILVHFLEGRIEEDVFQTFYRLNTHEMILQHAASSGFRTRELKFVSTSAATVMLGPVVIIELLWLRILNHDTFRHRRTNIVAVLQTKVEPAGQMDTL